MSRALPSEDRWMQSVIENGLGCSSCGSEFVEAHGRKASCAFCFSRMTLAEQLESPKAIHEEKNVRAIISVARARKAARAAKVNQESE